jgi:hypothetical protein
MRNMETILTRSEEDSVKTLLGKLQKLKIEKDVAIGSLLLNMQELQEEIGTKSAPFDSARFAIEEEIKSLMPSIAKTIKTEYGAANFRRSSVRISYDAKALDACPDEYVKAVILPYRKETPVASLISVEVY